VVISGQDRIILTRTRALKLHVNQVEKARLKKMGVPVLDYDGAAYFDFESFEDLDNVRSSVVSLSFRTAYDLGMRPDPQ